MAYLTQRQEKKLLKHIEKWGIPFNRYKTTYVSSTDLYPAYFYFNTEKYQIRFNVGEDNVGGIDTIVKRQFQLSDSYSLNKDEPHIRNAINKGYYCPCNDPIYYSQCSEEKLEEIKQRLDLPFL